MNETTKLIILFGYGLSIALSFVVFITYGIGLNLKDGDFRVYVYSVLPYEGYIEEILLIAVMVLSLIGYVLYIDSYLRKRKLEVTKWNGQ